MMPGDPRAPRVVPLGDRAVLVEFGQTIDEQVNVRAVAFASAFEAQRIAGVRDVVPAYASVAIHFDPVRTRLEDVEAAVAALAAEERSAPRLDDEVVEVPCCYGGDAGPDLPEVAAWAGLAAREVVARHAGRVYRVCMIGFLPGFPYMAGVDPAIGMPRRDIPRVRVAAGSVGIASRQTGIYPVESPGGWRIVGRTSIALFDVAREPVSWLWPGARVRFVPVDELGRREGGGPA